MHSLHKSEFIIQEVVGCGPFQVAHIFTQLFVTKIATVFTMLFMMFGFYNPGWKCLPASSNNNETTDYNQMPNDSFYNHTRFYSNYTKGYYDSRDLSNITLEGQIKDGCLAFESCDFVEFSSETSTIVSEWGLLCSRKWALKTIIALQMAGVGIGSLFNGYIADGFGRKAAIYMGQAGLIIFNFISIFSVSWKMFAALRFFLGIFLSFNLTLHNVYSIEFVTKKWRGPICGIPEFSICGFFFSITCLCLKDWWKIHIVITILALIGFLPAVWFPESLRWLEVKNKTQQFENAVKKIAKVNGKKLPKLDNLEHNISSLQFDGENTAKRYTHFHLFGKSYRMNSLLITLPWFSVSMIYYVVGFGVKSLYGNFYINLIIMNVISLPFMPLQILLPNLLGRKFASVVFCNLTAICFIGAACFETLTSGDIKTTGVLVCIFGSKISVVSFWIALMSHTLELYPTVVRGLSSSWGFTMARLGGIVAPFLIPNEKETFFISYIIMAVTVLLCVGCVMKLPETKDCRLQETIEQGERDTTRC